MVVVVVASAQARVIESDVYTSISLSSFLLLSLSLSLLLLHFFSATARQVQPCPQGAFAVPVLWHCIAQLRYLVIDGDWHSKCVFAAIAWPPRHWTGVSDEWKGAGLNAALRRNASCGC